MPHAVSAWPCCGASTASTGSPANPFGYGGQQLDRASGLYKMGQRYYDPTLARWSAQDLLTGGLSSPQSFNRYAAVLGNPISAIDASGLCIPQTFIGPLTAIQQLDRCTTPASAAVTATTAAGGTVTLQGSSTAGGFTMLGFLHDCISAGIIGAGLMGGTVATANKAFPDAGLGGAVGPAAVLGFGGGCGQALGTSLITAVWPN